jgi:hypothetical protein
MEATSASEAKLYRRCSLAALGILLGSMAGERVFNAEEPRPEARRACTMRWNVEPPPAYTFRLLDHFISMAGRHLP